MRSLLIEFHRFGKDDTGVLREGDHYLVAAATHPVRDISMPIDYDSFLDKMQALRYKGDIAERTKALQELGTIVTEMLGTKALPDVKTGDFPLQLDLVVNAAELAALPFEAATDANDRPLLTQRELPIVLTRRVRHDFAEVRVTWLAKPRILFAWAFPEGAGVAVPYEEHARALRHALEPWIPDMGPAAKESDISAVLTVVEKASLDSIKKACEDAIAQKKPYSHVHLLAHGCSIGRGFKQRFGVALHDPASGELQAASPEELGDALVSLRGQPVILTLAACDAANQTNTIIADKSIAHALHVSGIPVVVASQLPLTILGSTLLVQHFYEALLRGDDVRLALHEARCALFNSPDSGHDYVSLVGYVQLPEGYKEQLSEVRLQSVLTSLKALRSCADDLLNCATYDPAQFDRLTELLRGRAQLLENCLPETEKATRKGMLEEHLGLLGSCEKRLAELYFERGIRSGLSDWDQSMRESLERGRSWYKRGFDCNLSHHWDGVQSLSLEAVLTGRISEPGLWQAATIAAEIERKNKPEEAWALGSLAELQLLALAARQAEDLPKAIAMLEEMKTRVANRSDGDRFPLESTARQFRRYVKWWTNQNGFFPGRTDFSLQAKRLAEVLTR